MARFAQRPLLYRIGFCLYFLASLVFVYSIAISQAWLYDQEQGSDKYERFSLWNTKIRMCTKHSSGRDAWDCKLFPVDYAHGERMLAVTLITLGVCFQLAACCIITFYNTYLSSVDYHFQSEVAAGCAEALCFTGLLIYIKFTHYGLNLSYGPGLFLYAAAIPISYLGLMMTARWSIQITASS